MGENEVARIGDNFYPMAATHIITMHSDEVWCGISSSSEDEMKHFQFITAQLEW